MKEEREGTEKTRSKLLLSGVAIMVSGGPEVVILLQGEKFRK